VASQKSVTGEKPTIIRRPAVIHIQIKYIYKKEKTKKPLGIAIYKKLKNGHKKSDQEKISLSNP
jgi:hypothetical protein